MTLFEYTGAKHWFDNADLANRQTATGVVNFSNCTFVKVDGRIIDAGRATGGNEVAVCGVGRDVWL